MFDVDRGPPLRLSDYSACAIVLEHNVPDDCAYIVDRQIFVSPRGLIDLKIEMHPGLTYAQRSTLHARVRWEKRRRALKGGPPTVFEELLRWAT
jgi:hypothetical protein